AVAADIVDQGIALQRVRQLIPERWSTLAHPLDQPLVPQDLEHLQADRARKWGAVPGMADGELARPGCECLVHVVRAENRTDRRVAGAESLGRGDDVRHQRQLLGGEPVARPAYPGDHLVVADEKTVTVAALRQAAPELLGR